MNHAPCGGHAFVPSNFQDGELYQEIATQLHRSIQYQPQIHDPLKHEQLWTAHEPTA